MLDLTRHDERSSSPSSTSSSSSSSSSAMVCSDTLNAGISLLLSLAQQTHASNNTSGAAPTTPQHKAFKIPLVSSYLLLNRHLRLSNKLNKSYTHVILTLISYI